MKVEIETGTGDLDIMPILFNVIGIAKQSKSISECINRLNAINESIFLLEYGSGGNHIWVKQKMRDNRILLIT